MPSILPPIATSRLHRSTISGSRAALNNWLRPVASTAAISAFSVAPTDTTGKVIVAARQPPFGRGGFHIAGGQLDLGAQALRAPANGGRSGGRRSRSRRAAKRWIRPPAPASARGRGSRRASCGPCRRARRSRRSRRAWSVIRRPYSPFLTPSILVETPSWLSRWPKLSTSASRGRLPSVSGSSVSSAHGSRVSAAFLAPEMGIFPSRRLPPWIQMLSIGVTGARLPCARGSARASGASQLDRHPATPPPASSGEDAYAFSSVHCSGCWFSRAKSMTWVTLVSATS